MNDTIALHWIDWAIIISYIIFSLGVGIYFSKRAGKSTEEYFLSGRSLPWWLVGTSMVATTFAADTPLAITEFVRGPGIWENWFWWNGALGSLLGIFLFPGMIEDWRNKWDNEFPFYFVQIAPFRYTEDPLKNVSQNLREAQRRTLKLPNTGMVVTLDIGDFDNIHPANKKDVGKRLARLALVNDYDFDLAPLGPILSESGIFENTIKLSFTHVGSGLKYLNSVVFNCGRLVHSVSNLGNIALSTNSLAS